MKSLKLKTIIFSVLLIVMTLSIATYASAAKAVPQSARDKIEYTNLQVAIPVPNCNSLKGALGDVKCEGNQITAVKDLPAFIVAIFQFGIILISSVIFVLMIVGGVIYMTSAGNKSRADKGLGYIKNAAYSLLALMFSYFILNTINPSLTNLDLKGVGNITGKYICEEISKPAKCSTTENCVWTNNSCRNANNIKCIEASTKPECTKELYKSKRCVWVATLGDKGSCVEKRLKLSGACERLPNTQACISNTGCIWEYGCNLQPGSFAIVDAGLDNPCTKYKYDSTCLGNVSCDWYQKGSCMLASDAYTIDCQGRSKSDCKNRSACYWENETNTCLTATAIGKTCKTYDDCSITQFCDDKTDTCQKRLGQNEVCGGRSKGESITDFFACQKGYFCNNSILQAFADKTCLACTIREDLITPSEKYYCNQFKP